MRLGRSWRSRTRPPAYLPAYLIAGVALVFVYFAVSADAVKAVLYDGLVASSGIAVLVGVRRHRPEKALLWNCLAVSMFALALGDVTFDFLNLVRHVDPVPVPSWADAFYLAGYPFMIFGMWGMARRRLPSRLADTVLDFLVIAMAAGLAIGGPLVAANAGSHRSIAAVVVTTIYPSLDIAALLPACYLLLHRGFRNPATQLLLASLVFLAIGDVVFAYLGANGYDVGAGVDVTWLAHAVFLGAAALHPAMNDVSARRHKDINKLTAVRAAIFGAALIPLIIGPISASVLDGARYLETPTRAALVAVVLVRLLRLSSQMQQAHEESAQRAAALAMAREEIAHIVEGAADAIVGGDDEGTITAWNHGAERLLGIPAEQAIGQPIAQFVAEDIEPWAEAFRNMMPGDIRSAVLPAQRADGVSILVDVRLGLATTPDSKVTGWVAIARDASEALVANSAGTAANLDAGTVLENVRAIVGRVVDVKAVGLISFDREAQRYHEVLTVGDRIAIHLPDDGSFGDDACNALRDLPTVFRAVDDASGLIPVSFFMERAQVHRCVGITIHHATMGPVGLMLIGLDTAESPPDALLETIRSLVPSLTRVARSLMLAEEEESSARRTAEFDSMRADFSNFVRHDMREQVAAIRSAVNVLSDNKIELGDTWRDRLMANLSSSVETLERLVGDVAMAGLVVDGRFPCHLREMGDLGALIHQTVDELQRDVAQPINVAIGDLPPIRGDAERLAQALRHIIANAAKFSPADETITVSANFEAGTRRVRIAVRDHGIGIAPEDQALIFRRFARLTPAAGRSRTEGTGLGLYIAQGIVESHGGRISVRSQPGEGSVFYVELPVTAAVPVLS